MFSPGQEVVVEYKGIDHRAIVKQVARHSDYVLVYMPIDPEMDYGRVTPALPPDPVMWRKAQDLRLA